MARFTGTNLEVVVENSGGTEGTLTNVVSFTAPTGYEEVQFRGDTLVSYQAGQWDGKVEVETEWDSTATTGNWAVLSGIHGDNTNGRYVRLRPQGGTAGYPEYAQDSVLLELTPGAVNREGKVVLRAVFGEHTEASANSAWGTVT